MECKVIGNKKHTRTEIVIPFESDIVKKIVSVRKVVTGIEARLAKIEKTLKNMKEANRNFGTVDEARQKVYGSLY